MECFVTTLDFVYAVRYTGHNRDELPPPKEGGWLSSEWKPWSSISYYSDGMLRELHVYPGDWVLAYCDEDLKRNKRAFAVLQHEQFVALFEKIDKEKINE